MDWSPIVLIEGVMVLGGALAWGWWELRGIKKDNEQVRQAQEKAKASEPQ